MSTKRSKLEQSVQEIHAVDDAESRYIGRGRVHPLSRLLVTLCYLVMVLSFHKYDFLGVAGMILYLLVQGIWHEVSIREMFGRIWPVLLMTGLVGIANPFLDRSVYLVIGDIAVTYGMLSMVTLLMKGVFCAAASYLLVHIVGIRQLCFVLRLLHFPEQMITVLLLMHRYLIVLLQELKRMQQAYRLRAAGRRGLHVRAWGSFVGLFLLRSIDCAESVYESMQLRGFQGSLYSSVVQYHRGISISYTILWIALLMLLRIVPVFQIVGSLF